MGIILRGKKKKSRGGTLSYATTLSYLFHPVMLSTLSFHALHFVVSSVARNLLTLVLTTPPCPAPLPCPAEQYRGIPHFLRDGIPRRPLGLRLGATFPTLSSRGTLPFLSSRGTQVPRNPLLRSGRPKRMLWAILSSRLRQF